MSELQTGSDFLWPFFEGRNSESPKNSREHPRSGPFQKGNSQQKREAGHFKNARYFKS
jgi:hypothetical protein